jgi:hypothetical protein
MFIVLRKSSVKRTLALAVLLIVIGISLAHPVKVQATSNLFYLYPYPNNNPVNQNGLFWAEEAPTWGAFNLSAWEEFEPNKLLVIGIPDEYQVNATMIGNNLSKYIMAKIGKRNSKTTGSKSSRDILIYEREIGPGFIKEKVKVEIIDHFKDNDNFEKYMEIVKNHLTDREVIPPKPTDKADNTAQTTMMFGNTMILGGLAMLVRVLALAAL